MTIKSLSLLAATLWFSISPSVAQDFNFQEILPEHFDKANIIEEEDYNVWGTNILKGKDGKYHAIYSRWPKGRGHHGWVTHSEIAHAVSDKLTGPYVFKNLVLPARGKDFWDGDCTHNPTSWSTMESTIYTTWATAAAVIGTRLQTITCHRLSTKSGG
ncbi:hypothetical protein [Pelagicoccus mobilis]|uniref:Uncharacterized protein n=1 Tax=Pelagicoccus mobilis TaxID=415221 RepID=A0A934S3X9_9BACT|nr:hypothetical protein [Pelagicoccus mobilis]MBK1878949.1 hypothetical protein [Pelagicoccus mobilis]